MVRKFAALFALILTFGLAAAPMAAQDVDADDFQDMGILSGYVRSYLVDPNSENPTTSAQAAMIVGIEFESKDLLDSGFEPFACGFAAPLFGIPIPEDTPDDEACALLSDGGANVTNVTDMGDQAIEVTNATTESGAGSPMNILILQSDHYLFAIIHLGDNTSGVGDELGHFLVDADPVNTDVELIEDGTSTGGFFDMLPREGDTVIEGLMPFEDADLFAEISGTPESADPDMDSTPAS